MKLRENNIFIKNNEYRLANEIHEMFINPELKIFDKMEWWAGWKWHNLFYTDNSYLFRYIMNAVEYSLKTEDVKDFIKTCIKTKELIEIRNDLIHIMKLLNLDFR